MRTLLFFHGNFGYVLGLSAGVCCVLNIDIEICLYDGIIKYNMSKSIDLRRYKKVYCYLVTHKYFHILCVDDGNKLYAVYR